ncbi:MAG: M23 family metallopeptidase [Vicinamibacterales bacterium]|nr:M23 family metallopeptidase [Vicinamibacterales bacterium]
MPLRIALVLFGTLILVAGGFAAYVASREPGPLLTIHGPEVIGGGTFVLDVSVDASREQLSSLDARLEQGGRRYPVMTLATSMQARLTQEADSRVRVRQDVATASLEGIRDGNARLIVSASSPVLFGVRHARTEEGRDIAVRLSPPTLAVLSTHHFVTMGGSEMIVYRVSPPDCESGVMVGDRLYRGYPARGVAGGRATDPTLHVAFFALPFDQDTNVPIRLTARDAVGNSTVVDFDHRAFPATFSYSRLAVDDRFLARVVPPIVENTPGLALATGTAEERLDAFLHINRELRRSNAEQLAALATETSPEWLARGAFLRLPGSASTAPFAEHRTYMLGPREIDQQVHMGFDLASTKHAAVVASNTGRVTFAGYLGIYGNCIVIDHGMGVQTLYGHLSAMDVEKGDRVEKGETIGRSGTTGIAGGDHVHFTVLVGGTPVTPIEWWDPKWTRDRLERKLAEAGIR